MTNNKSNQQTQSKKTKLSRCFSFWFSFMKNQVLEGQNKVQNWEQSQKQVCNVDTVEDFWAYYQHMARPDALPVNSGYQFFQYDIKPMWEDVANLKGGRFILRFKKECANQFWENILLAFIGGKFERTDLICGVVCSAREGEVMLSIWVKAFANPQEKNTVKKWILDSLDLSENIDLGYKDHPKSKNESHQ